jgi:membrane-bound lytic murein transglycosylase B
MEMVRTGSVIAWLLLSLWSCSATAISKEDYPALEPFIQRMVQKHNFEQHHLLQVLAQAKIQPSIIQAISRPAERKPWYQYRPIFVNQQRIEGGVRFWQKNRASLLRAQQEYGVAPEIIVAIIGVETRYGNHQGRYRVIDALATLAFAYPPRSKFFTSELEHYLLMTREHRLDPLQLTGSYAGAMGQPQFISSSYRSYAVDFDGDGHSDIWQNPVDAIGSVANYFQRHGWQPGQPVAVELEVGDINIQHLLTDELEPGYPVAMFRKLGLKIPRHFDDAAPAKLLQLEVLGGYVYWLGLQNFYVITRYNHSPLYAMAVYQLSKKIREQYRQQAKANGTVD